MGELTFAKRGLKHSLGDEMERGLDPIDLKTALCCISFLRKGEVLAYVGRIHNRKDLKEGRGPGECFRDRAPDMRLVALP